ncbi:MAG: hypothetical protein ISS18_14770 [Bacteroidales bacterium]|nr:hypothetical protein [Bacteroidales bacterium]
MDSTALNVSLLIMGVALIILFIVILNYKLLLKLWVYKAYYGKFSYKYVDVFTKHHYYNPYRQAQTFEIDLFLNSLTNKSKEELITDNDIVFQGFELGKSYPDFRKQKGDPDYFTIQEFKDVQICIWGYGFKMYDYYAIVLFCFIDKIFVLGQYNFKKESQNVDFTDISNKLINKYFNDEEKICQNQKEIKIKDTKGSKVHLYDDGFSIRVSYFNPDIPIIKEKLINSEQQVTIENSPELETITF